MFCGTITGLPVHVLAHVERQRARVEIVAAAGAEADCERDVLCRDRSRRRFGQTPDPSDYETCEVSTDVISVCPGLPDDLLRNRKKDMTLNSASLEVAERETCRKSWQTRLAVTSPAMTWRGCVRLTSRDPHGREDVRELGPQLRAQVWLTSTVSGNVPLSFMS